MKLDISGKEIKLKKELNDLDKLALDFTKILDLNRVRYVLVSGYVSILFGRSRSSEDIDIIVEKISMKKFAGLWKHILRKFECINAVSMHDAYERHLMAGSAVRFARKGKFIPNIEFKFPKIDLENWVLDNRKVVALNRYRIKISPIELQIAYKLILSTGKDIEDARHLYKLFKGMIDEGLLKYFLEKFDKEDAFNRYVE
ncbi:MAG: hypothetical protein QXN83_05280 [Nitrososphaerales archaeon]